MAKRVIVELVDDCDGKSTAEETVLFSLDGVEYEIDLSVKNAGKLRDVFEPWTGAARRVGRAPKSKGATRSTGKRGDTAAIREWARKNGHQIAARGRVHAEIVRAYELATA
ncbi:histone-like nucleoid-structuring protein Lsr2 [Nocardia vaccinii]|uniref:histone-like nucleoid-structuring protein Lsr2 n=1 Tax=Nocardia vaccinii TaxID=1822 RepID=UPI00083306C3|nr:Lsr2 family protein [Nocardia vaccinii]